MNPNVAIGATMFILWAVNILGGGFILLHVIRSTIRNKSLSRDTMRMYLGVFFMTVLVDLAVAKVFSTEVLAGFVGAVIGGALGTKVSGKEED